VRTLRRNGYRGPIIMLTAQESDDDMVEGLEAGANDYVIKPFKFRLLRDAVQRPGRRRLADDGEFVVGVDLFRQCLTQGVVVVTMGHMPIRIGVPR
jgi:DNA-binding response OmpR family regulator